LALSLHLMGIRDWDAKEHASRSAIINLLRWRFQDAARRETRQVR
jgi:hypothetical protein